MTTLPATLRRHVPLVSPHALPVRSARSVRAEGDGFASGGNQIYTGDLNDPRFKEFLRGGAGAETSSGALVSPRTSTRVTAVMSCVRLIARSIAMLPYPLYDELVEGKKRKAIEHAVYKLISRRPNRWQTAFQFWSMMIAHVLLRGNAYAFKVYSMGRLIELIPLHPDRMEVAQLADLSISYTYTRANGSRVTWSQEDIFHLADLTDDGVKGLSVITQAAETIGLAMQAERAGARMFKHGNINGGALSSDQVLGDQTIEDLKESLKQYQGADNAGKWLVLEQGLKPTTLGISMVDMQFIESRRFSVEDIARIFGVPPHMIGAMDKATSFGSGIENQTLGFVQFTLQPWLTCIDQTVQRDCLTDAEADRYYPRHNLAALLRGTAKDRAEYFKAMLGAPGQKGWGSQNEVRALDDMNSSDDPGAESIEPLVTAATMQPNNTQGAAS